MSMRYVLIATCVVAISAAQAAGQTPLQEGDPPVVEGPKASGDVKLPPPTGWSALPTEVIHRHVGDVHHHHHYRYRNGNGNGGRRRRPYSGTSSISYAQALGVAFREEFPKAYVKGEQMAVKDAVICEGRARIGANSMFLYEQAKAAGVTGLLPPMGKPLPFQLVQAQPSAPPSGPTPPSSQPGPGAGPGAQPPAGPVGPPAGGQVQPPATPSGPAVQPPAGPKTPKAATPLPGVSQAAQAWNLIKGLLGLVAGIVVAFFIGRWIPARVLRGGPRWATLFVIAVLVAAIVNGLLTAVM